MVTHCVGEGASMTSPTVAASGGGTGSPAASPLPTQVDSAPATPTQQRRTNENRRSNKPIMEKRRRARINNCLNELKSLILDAMKKDPARHSKLEKADILEMTVKHLENMQRQQVAMTTAADPQVLNKFRAGFSECAGEVGRFPGLEPPVRRRLLQHLANVLNNSTGNGPGNADGASCQTTAGTPAVQPAGVQVHILPATGDSGILFSTTASGGGLQLVPTRLPNGDIALVLPSANATRQPSPGSPLPMLVPIPARAASADPSPAPVATVSSSTSPISFERLSVSTTPSPQPDPLPDPEARRQPDGHRHDLQPSRFRNCVQQPAAEPKPLSLVTKKRYEEIVATSEEKPWRPW